MSPEDTVTIKLDVEGVEFRCIQEMIESDMWPSLLYLEDGCRKIFDKLEWQARIFCYDHIRDNKLQASVRIEDNTKAYDEYILCYMSIESHPQYAFLRDRNKLFQPLHKTLVEHFKKICLQYPGEVTKVVFGFQWLTCHQVLIFDNEGKTKIWRTTDPLNSTKDADWVTSLPNVIEIEHEHSGQAKYSIQQTESTLDTAQKRIDHILCKALEKKVL